jgi:hypothetical protein
LFLPTALFSNDWDNDDGVGPKGKPNDQQCMAREKDQSQNIKQNKSNLDLE